jgi:type VI secretion system Hcp family effector
MMRNVIVCGLVVAGLAAGCGGQEMGMSDPNAQVEARVNPLEASGMVTLYVKVVGADGTAFGGESTQNGREDFIPAIQFYSDITKASAGGATKCTTFNFTKAAGTTSPLFARAISSGETLKSVHMDFVKEGGLVFTWQTIDLTGVRVSMLEQGSTTPGAGVSSGLLEEVSLTPVGTANVTLTSIPQREDGTAGASIVTPFTCKGG